MLNLVRVLPIEDGGNPRNESDIKRVEEGFLIHPFSEDDDANYRFRLNVQIINDADQPIPVQFHMDWGDASNIEHRGYVLLSQEDEQWETFATELHDTVASAVIPVPPGISYLCMHPRYEHGRFTQYVEGLPQDKFRVEVIGKSRRSRDVLGIEVGNKQVRPVAVMARVHPYETIASYLVEGMLEWLKGDGEDVRQFLSEHRVVFVPMPNPDGVAEGTCKLTMGGLNFSVRGSITTEPEGKAVRDYFLRTQPMALFDLHGWMLAHDNICTNDTVRGRAIYAKLMERSDLFDKGIEVLYKKYPWVGRENNLGGLLVDRISDAVYYNTSWCWYGRTAAEVREMGVTILKAYSGLFTQQ